VMAACFEAMRADCNRVSTQKGLTTGLDPADD